MPPIIQERCHDGRIAGTRRGRARPRTGRRAQRACAVRWSSSSGSAASGVLAGAVCHELNNALTPILNYAKLGLRNPDPEFRRRAFEKILDGAQRAAAITGGRARPGPAAGRRREPTDLVRLAEEVAPARRQGPPEGPRPASSSSAEGRPARPGQPGADPAGAAEPGHQRPPGDARGRDGPRPRRHRRPRAGWPRSAWPTPASGSPRPTSGGSSSRSSPPRPAPTPPARAGRAWACRSAATSSRPTRAASAPRAGPARAPPSPSASPPAPPRPRRAAA